MTYTIAVVHSPKLARDRSRDWYRYYAGYSPEFVRDVLEILEVDAEDPVLDPWNGSGTTTSVAHAIGVPSLGFDANPALVVIARSRLLGRDVVDSIEPLLSDLLDHAASDTASVTPPDDPLVDWFSDGTASDLRRIERSIHHVLVSSNPDSRTTMLDTDKVSTLAAFFYVALFDVVRSALRAFVGSNPTWVKTPPGNDRRVLKPVDLASTFNAAVARLRFIVEQATVSEAGPSALIGLATSTSLPLLPKSVAAVVSSPPYCTRIDYVMATRPELAVLGYTNDAITTLRATMLGTPTMTQQVPNVMDEWGGTAAELIRQVSTHSSRASGTYYRKYFLQYLGTLWESLSELRRVLRDGGSICLVVQDSYYKDLSVDLARIITEMFATLGLAPASLHLFSVPATKAAIHPGSKKWRKTFSAMESVLIFN